MPRNPKILSVSWKIRTYSRLTSMESEGNQLDLAKIERPRRQERRARGGIQKSGERVMKGVHCPDKIWSIGCGGQGSIVTYMIECV